MASFYKCDECECILMPIGGPEAACEKACLRQLAANTSDGAKEKHVPVVSVEDGKVVVRVGEAPHPMLPEHYIEWVYVKTSFGGIWCRLNPGDAPEVAFKIVPGEVEEVYAYCNLHKLWKAKEPVLPLDFDMNTVACSAEFTAGCLNPSGENK